MAYQAILALNVQGRFACVSQKLCGNLVSLFAGDCALVRHILLAYQKSAYTDYNLPQTLSHRGDGIHFLHLAGNKTLQSLAHRLKCVDLYCLSKQ